MSWREGRAQRERIMSRLTFQFQQFRENRRMAKSVSLKDNHHNEPVTDLLLLPTCGCVFMCGALQWIGLFFWVEDIVCSKWYVFYAFFHRSSRLEQLWTFQLELCDGKLPSVKIPRLKLLHSNLLVKKCFKALLRFWKFMMTCGQTFQYSYFYTLLTLVWDTHCHTTTY